MKKNIEVKVYNHGRVIIYKDETDARVFYTIKVEQPNYSKAYFKTDMKKHIDALNWSKEFFILTNFKNDISKEFGEELAEKLKEQGELVTDETKINEATKRGEIVWHKIEKN